MAVASKAFMVYQWCSLSYICGGYTGGGGLGVLAYVCLAVAVRYSVFCNMNVRVLPVTCHTCVERVRGATILSYDF